MSKKSLHEINSKKHERKAALLTFLCSSSIGVLCFFLIAFTIQDPPPGEQYVAVDFAEIGDVEDAGGVTETEVSSEVVEEVIKEQEALESIQKPVQAEKVVTQENSEMAVQEVIEEVVEQEHPVEESERVSQGANLISNFANSGGGSQGNSEGAGNQGAEVARIEGTGLVTGDFGSAFLNGGNLVNPPKLNEDPKKEGVVRINIIVRGDGTVKSPTYDAKNSTIADSRHVGLAKTAALTATFTTSTLPARSGYIDIRFELE